MEYILSPLNRSRILTLPATQRLLLSVSIMTIQTSGRFLIIALKTLENHGLISLKIYTVNKERKKEGITADGNGVTASLEE